MKAVLIFGLLALLAISSVSAAADATDDDYFEEIPGNKRTKAIFSVMRGFITGYYKGMYKKTNYAVQT
jgi:hypothetical protein